MAIPSAQTAFSAGEISPELYGEVNLQKYSSAVTTGRNMFVSYRGGLMSRAGFAIVGVSLQTIGLTNGTTTGPPRVITFQFSITEGYSLEFGDLYLRFIFQGGYVLESPVTITAATQADPVVISVTGTPFTNGDWVFISGVNGMTQLNGNTYIVAGATPGSFTLTDLSGNPVNGTSFGPYVSGGTAARIYTISTPYFARDLPYLKFSQSADVMTLTCSNPVSNVEYPPQSLTRLAGADWTLVPTDFNALIAAPASVSAVAAANAPSTGINATFGYQVTAVDKKGNESLASIIASCHGADLEVEGGTNTVTWAAVSGALYYNVYRSPASVDSSGHQNPVPAGSIYGFVGSSFGTQFLDTQSVSNLTQVPPNHANPFAPGQILDINITSPGSGLTTVTWAITSATGGGFAGYPVVTGGGLSAFPITNPGNFYEPGDSIAFNGAGFASGAIVFAANPSPGDTITLNGQVWTFVSAITAGAQTLIKGALSDTLSQLVSDLSASSIPVIAVAQYTVDGTSHDLLITYNTPGPAGNAYTLAASAATPSGPTLTGGTGTGGTAPTATLDIGPNSGTYPGCNAYFQQRLFFANSFNDPDTFWASQTGRFANFDTRIPTVPDDAITASPWTEQVNGIQWLVAMPGGLIAMTGRRAWQIVGEGSYALNVQPITPSTTQAQPQAFNGCSATVQPIVIDYDVIYVEAVGNTTVRDLSYNFFTSIYTGADLTLLSSHLFLYQQIVYMAWARKPYKVLWACRDDGTMLSLTYLKEQEVYGWARHDTQGLVLSVTSVTEPPVDALYAVVQRFPPYAPNGIYTVERMDDRIWQTVEDAYAVDSGVSNPLTFPAASLRAPTGTGSETITASQNVFSPTDAGSVVRMSGGIAVVDAYVNVRQLAVTWVLDANPGTFGEPFAAPNNWSIAPQVTTLNAPHLAGMTVVGLADGVPISGMVVGPTGLITLPFPASNVKVGLPFLPQMQTPYLNGQGVVQGARKAIPAVTVRLAASGPFQFATNQPDGAAQNPPQIGPVWTNLDTADFSQPTGGQEPPVTYTSPGGQPVTQLWTGDYRIVGGGDEWNSKGQVAIQQPVPLALEVTLVAPEGLPGDTPENTYEPRQQQQQPRGPGPWMIKAPRI